MAYRLTFDQLPREGRRVLIAEDEPSILRLLQLQLERCGCKVYAAKDGQQALDILRMHELDAAVLDVMMPHVDGLAVLREIRKDPKTENLPVILLTVKAQDHEVYEGYREGADLYMTKPFDPTQIAELLCA